MDEAKKDICRKLLGDAFLAIEKEDDIRLFQTVSTVFTLLLSEVVISMENYRQGCLQPPSTQVN